MAVKIDTSHNSPNFTTGANCPSAFGYARTLIGDTVHHWDEKGAGATWAGTLDTLTNDYRNPGSRGVSAHYMVESGRAACLVDLDNAAWHAGNARGNAQTIGWELNPDESAGTYQTFAEALAQSWKLVPRPHKLFPHRDWTSTRCPGDYDLARLLRMAEVEFAKLNGSKPVTVAPAATSVKPIPAKKPAPAPVLVNRIVTNPVANVRTAPRSNAPVYASYPKGTVISVKGFVVGENPYGATPPDNAWYVTKSGYYVWANAAQNTLAGLRQL